MNSYSEIYRPTKVSQLIGKPQQIAATQLLDKVKAGNLSREVLFTGPSGVGKTTIARMYAQKIIGKKLDLDSHIEVVNCSADTGIDNVRVGFIERIRYKPLPPSKYRIFFFDEIHGLSKSAQNALLIPVEKLPEHVVLIASTTDPRKLIKPLRSRFDKFALTVPTKKDFEILWDRLLDKNDQTKPTKEIRDEIISAAKGNVRDFVKLFQAVVEGGYVSQVSLESDPKWIGNEIIYVKQLSLGKMFSLVSQVTSFTPIAMGMCNQAISLIEKTNNELHYTRAVLILKYFGSGFNGKTQEKIEFFHQLAMLHLDKEIQGE